MSWRTDYLTMSIEGSPDAAFTAGGIVAVQIAVMFFYPIDKDLSSTIEYVSRHLARGTTSRSGVHIVTAPFSLQARDAEASEMDHGQYLRMKRILKKMPYRRITGTTTYANTGDIPVAAEHVDTVDGADTFFAAEFPKLIICEDDIEARPAPGGLFTAEFDLLYVEASF